MARAETWAMERVEQVIEDLEKLRSRVAQIEARYSVLSYDYTQICEEALSKVNKLKPSSTGVEMAESRTPALTHANGKHRSARKTANVAPSQRRRRTNHPMRKALKSPQEVYETTTVEKAPETAIDKCDEPAAINSDTNALTSVIQERNSTASALEVDKDFKPAISAMIQSAEVLELGPGSSLSLEDLLEFQQKSKQPALKPRATPQTVIDSLARGIEFALDKLGDGLTFPFVLVVKIARKLKGRSKNTKGI